METTKRKPGRPRKASEANAVLMRSQLELDYENAMNKIDALQEDTEFFESKLYEERENLENMLKEIDKWIFQVIHHCAEVESNTGRIQLHDVDYCIDMVKRIMKHKFANKSTKD